MLRKFFDACANSALIATRKTRFVVVQILRNGSETLKFSKMLRKFFRMAPKLCGILWLRRQKTRFVVRCMCKFSQCANSPYGSETLKFSKNVPKILRLLCVALIPTTPHGLNLQKHALGLVPKARVCSWATWYDEKPEIVMNFLGIID